jgi:hypothetical protein
LGEGEVGENQEAVSGDQFLVLTSFVIVYLKKSFVIVLISRKHSTCPPLIRARYNETMDTITEWEAEKKAKARRQKELKDEVNSPHDCTTFHSIPLNVVCET